ncbi:allantoate amidohydrolase [Phytoactinopolyspora halophila]|nr:allantoate amidohydrolase [Phytoactinopolyspora halophila]
MHEFDRMWAELAPIGRRADGGYRRFAWTPEDAELREWFAAEAARRALDITVDRAGNQWAWWGDPDAGTPGVVTGSHLDSVPGGGAYDGPLGVVSAFLAIDLLREQGRKPRRPIGVVNFADEEGARFGVACAGSRLLTGQLEPARALALADDDGVSMAEAMRRAGFPADHVGTDPEALRRVATFVELHVEQGRGLADLGARVGVASMIWPHGRWRITLSGRANHAGTTPLAERCDPMLDLATLITEVRESAGRHGALATIGKVHVEPNGVNAIPARVTAWLDCRAAEQVAVEEVVNDVELGFETRIKAGLKGGVEAGVERESWTPATVFDTDLAARLGVVVGGQDGPAAPLLGTGAGHDAGVLSTAGVPTAMLFVRNPTGVSHAPDELAERDDCLAGVSALARCLAELTA